MIYNYEFYQVYLPGRPDNQTVARKHIDDAAAIIKYITFVCLPFVSYTADAYVALPIRSLACARRLNQWSFACSYRQL